MKIIPFKTFLLIITLISLTAAVRIQTDPAPAPAVDPAPAPAITPAATPAITPATTPAATPATGTTPQTTAPTATGPLHTNVVGAFSENCRKINTFEVTSCDQLVMFSGKRIPDINFYDKQEPGYFSISMYGIASYKTETAKDFIERIEMAKLVTEPLPLPGAINCVSFTSNLHKRINMCFEDVSKVKSLQEVFKKFQNCHLGISATPLPEINTKHIHDLACKK